MPSYTRLPMQVSGNCVVIPMSTLKAVLESTLGRADGWMTDGNGRGFLLRVSRGTGGSIVVEIY